jgi:SAM-dependent methyltransferase
LIALGGALGGVFVAVIAPVVFETYLELPLLVILIAELAVLMQWRRQGQSYRRWIVRGAMVLGVIALAFFMLLTEIEIRDNVFVERNFYGVLRVRDYDVGDELERRVLLHGTISHGYQYSSEAYRGLAGSYYSTNSGIGRTLLAAHAQGPIRFGVVGLGVGVLASYARTGDAVSIYEINPSVVAVAHELFDFVPQARGRGANVDIVLGDARLSLEQQAPQQFDVLALDAFSSDAIPSHLLTREAMDIYVRHLKPNGVLAIHISNRYLDLVPVCARAAEHLGRPAVVIEEPSDRMAHASTWVLITSNVELLKHQAFAGAQMQGASAPADFEGWSDQYSNVWKLLKLRATTTLVE